MIGIIITLLLSVFLEANFVSIPLTFATLLFWTVTQQRSEIFIAAFFAGLFLDALTYNSLGLSSAYFLLAIFAVFLYRSKFEIKTIGFVGVFGFLGSFIYMFVKGSGNIFWGSFLATLIILVCFKVYQSINLKQ